MPMTGGQSVHSKPLRDDSNKRFSLLFMFFAMVANALLPPVVVTVVCLGYLVLWLVAGSTPFRVPRDMLHSASLLLALLVLAAVMGYANNSWDFAKDGWYFLNPIISLLAGYACMRQVRSVGRIVTFTTAAGVIVSLVYLGEVAAHFPMLFRASVGNIRNANGPGFMLSFLVPLILLAARRLHIETTGLDGRGLRAAALAITLAAVVLSFSRTLWICLVIALPTVCNIRLRRVFTYTVCLAVLALVSFGLVGASAISGTQTDDETSMGSKLKRSVAEMIVSNYTDISDVNSNWRGFEAARALQTYMSGSLAHQLCGYGLGAMVDLGFYMDFDRTGEGSGMRYIPILHNGYMYVLVKSGIIGLMVYSAFIVALYRKGRAYALYPNADMAFSGTLLKVLAATILLSTAVITGIYNKTELFPVMFLLGALLSAMSIRSSECGANAPCTF